MAHYSSLRSNSLQWKLDKWEWRLKDLGGVFLKVMIQAHVLYLEETRADVHKNS